MTKRSLRADSKKNEPVSIAATTLAGLAGFSAAAAGAWVLYSKLAIDHHLALPDALPAERQGFISPRAGQLSYYLNRGQTGRPLVLIHSINAAASAYEMRPLFIRYFENRPVFALDLPGFGFSERSNRVYTPELYTTAVIDFLQSQVREPADVVALSLGGEFAVRAAVEQPDLFNSLALLSPTGFSEGSERGSQKAGRNGTGSLLHSAFAFPAWARAFYDLIATRSSIEYFLKQSFIGAVPPDLVAYAYATSHQPGAENAPLYFISGLLFTPTIRQTYYPRLKVPTLVLYDRDAFTRFDTLPELLATNPNWQAVRLVPSLGLPQFERLDDTVEVLNRFWK